MQFRFSENKQYIKSFTTLIMDVGYKLLEDIPNPVFKVTFDFHTDRPHFIILPKGVMSPDFSGITEDQKQQLIQAGKSVLGASHIDGGILSVHRGSWVSKKELFHAHVCVDRKKYLDYLKFWAKGPNVNWPSRVYKSGSWKESHGHKGYVQRVLDGNAYKCYVKESVKAIKADPDKDAEQKLAPLDEVPLKCGGTCKIVFHRKHPKIGFVGKKPESNQELQHVLSALEQFAQNHVLKNKNPGCHICLYLGSGMYIHRQS